MQAKRSLRFCQGNAENAITFILEQRKAQDEQKQRCDLLPLQVCSLAVHPLLKCCSMFSIGAHGGP